MDNCVFCKIAKKEIPCNLIMETDDMIAFHDLNPQAPVHALIIPKKHFSSLDGIDETELLGKLLIGAKEAAKKLNIAGAYRLVINTGESAGQTVFHIHIHLLGGRQLKWPPG
jgi:histidine triad (HIT) family protein